MELTDCQTCAAPITINDKFCPHCGSAQKEVPAGTKKCSKCNHENPLSAGFCEKCGTSLSGEQATTPPPQPEPNKIVSKGSYSGTMTKGKSKSGKRLLYGIITAVVVIGIALIIWFQVDPDAGEKLKTIAGGLLVVGIFLFMVFRGNKKGKRRRRRGFSGGNRHDDDNYDDDDYDDYDDDGDDGGDD